MNSALEHELTIHAAALRRMARALVAPADVDDLVQDTTLAALRSPPEQVMRLRAWLQTILRRLASSKRRADARRRQRERDVAAAEPAAAADVELARHEIIERLTRMLAALPEPYRDTLLQRFFADLRPAAIAARAGVPVETVKTRIKRGLSMLRQQLQGSGDWRLGLANAFGLGAAGSATTGGLLMATSSKCALAGAAAILSIGLFSVLRGPLAADAVASPPLSAVAAAAATPQGPRMAAVPSPRIDMTVASPLAAEVARELQCVDAASGRPVPNAQLWPASNRRTLPLPQPPLAVADADGKLALARVTAARAIVWSPATVPQAIDLSMVHGTQPVPLHRAHDLQVYCVDDHGAPVVDCMVIAADRPILLPDGVEFASGLANPALASGIAGDRTDATGVARLHGLPFAPMFLRADHAAMLPDDPHLNEHQPVAGGEDQVVLHLVPARAVVAMLPAGLTAASWDFAAPRDIDRSVYVAARQIEARLAQRFPGAGSWVCKSRHPSDAPIWIRAIANDGSLWTGAAALRRVDQIDAPVLLQPAAGNTGWLRIDLFAGQRQLENVDLTLVHADGGVWQIQSQQTVQVPCGKYSITLSQPLPRIDESVERFGFEVPACAREKALTIRADLGATFGWVRLHLRMDDGGSHPHAGLSVTLQSGDGFTIVNVPSGKPIMVPQGTQALTVGELGYVPWQETVEVEAGRIADIEVELHAARR